MQQTWTEFLLQEILLRGASLVVWAIRDGRDAAAQIVNYLQQKNNKNSSVEAA